MSICTWFCRTLAVGCFVSATFAQSEFTVVSSLIPGVRVDGPDAPGFANHLAEIGVDAKIREAAAAFLSRAIVVTNTSNRPIAKLVVRFDYMNPVGKMLADIQWQEPYLSLAPGSSRLVTASSSLAEAIRSRWPEDLLRSAVSGAGSGAIIRSPVVRISVDSVLFADGEFYGPDLSGAWDKLTQEQEFVRVARRDLEQLGDDMERVQRKLDEIYDPIARRKPVTGEGIRVTMLRERMFLLLRNKTNSYESFQKVLQSQFGNDTFLNLRRKY
jgi:hypothetical protein